MRHTRESLVNINEYGICVKLVIIKVCVFHLKEAAKSDTHNNNSERGEKSLGGECVWNETMRLGTINLCVYNLEMCT